jgi:hypothetical protein
VASRGRAENAGATSQSRRKDADKNRQNCCSTGINKFLASSAAALRSAASRAAGQGRLPISDAPTQAIGRIGVTTHKAVINHVAAERCRARATVPQKRRRLVAQADRPIGKRLAEKKIGKKFVRA